MKRLKTYEMYSTKYYWIIPLDDRLNDAIDIIVKELINKYSNYDGQLMKKSFLSSPYLLDKKAMFGVATANFIINSFEIIHNVYIEDIKFSNYTFSGYVNMTEEEFELYKNAENYNL